MSNPSLSRVHASLRLVSRTTPGAPAWRHMSFKPQPLLNVATTATPPSFQDPGVAAPNAGRDAGSAGHARGTLFPRLPRLAGGVWPLRWSSSAACAQAGVVSVLTPAEVLVAARRLAGARPHLAAMAGIVAPEDLWQLCRDKLTASTSAPAAGISAVAGLAWSSGPRRGSGSCGAARQSPGE